MKNERYVNELLPKHIFSVIVVLANQIRRA